MLLDQVFDTFTVKKHIFARKNGKLKRITKTITFDTKKADNFKPLFPISKDRSENNESPKKDPC